MQNIRTTFGNFIYLSKIEKVLLEHSNKTIFEQNKKNCLFWQNIKTIVSSRQIKIPISFEELKLYLSYNTKYEREVCLNLIFTNSFSINLRFRSAKFDKTYMYLPNPSMSSM